MISNGGGICIDDGGDDGLIHSPTNKRPLYTSRAAAMDGLRWRMTRATPLFCMWGGRSSTIVKLMVNQIERVRVNWNDLPFRNGKPFDDDLWPHDSSCYQWKECHWLRIENDMDELVLRCFKRHDFRRVCSTHVLINMWDEHFAFDAKLSGENKCLRLANIQQQECPGRQRKREVEKEEGEQCDNLKWINGQNEYNRTQIAYRDLHDVAYRHAAFHFHTLLLSSCSLPYGIQRGY